VGTPHVKENQKGGSQLVPPISDTPFLLAPCKSIWRIQLVRRAEFQNRKTKGCVALGLQDPYAITQQALLPPGHENELLLCMSSAYPSVPDGRGLTPTTAPRVSCSYSSALAEMLPSLFTYIPSRRDKPHPRLDPAYVREVSQPRLMSFESPNARSKSITIADGPNTGGVR
jgi:hypothetical protein